MQALLKKSTISLLLLVLTCSSALARPAFFWLRNKLTAADPTLIDMQFKGAFDENFTQPATCQMDKGVDFHCDSQGKNIVFGQMTLFLNDHGNIETIPCTPESNSLPNYMIWTVGPISYNMGILDRTNGKITCTISLGK